MQPRSQERTRKSPFEESRSRFVHRFTFIDGQAGYFFLIERGTHMSRDEQIAREAERLQRILGGHYLFGPEFYRAYAEYTLDPASAETAEQNGARRITDQAG
ncbi:MAG: hypothetical protein M3O06_02840 [Pseudomonadota bacterium]|nr:hypothetical protein [Pseudomonadota bacterium]